MKTKIVECPRDAMQGIKDQIPTEAKIAYINALMAAGFDTIDFGSFVSPKAVPQMADSREVVDNLDLSAGNSSLLAIIVNEIGAHHAFDFEEITYLGFPLSISETFQQRNANQSLEEALTVMRRIQNKCEQRSHQLIVYLSMGFGNPYGEEWNEEIVAKYVQLVAQEGVEIISLADTVGTAQPADISALFSKLIPEYDWIEFGAHLHASPSDWEAKIDAAYQAGCRRFDGALKGFGGCPFAKDELVGNVATENIVKYLDSQGDKTHKVKKRPMNAAVGMANEIFSMYH